MKKIRNLKFVLEELTPALETYGNKHFKCLIDINCRLLQLMRQGYVFTKRIKGYYCTTPTGITITDAQFCQQYLQDIYNKYIVKRAKTQFRGMFNLVARQYQGYINRNEIPTKLIHIKEKTISLKDNDLSLVNGQILVKNIFGDDFTLSFKNLGCLKNIKFLPKRFGGNLVFKQKCLIVKVDVDYEFKYAPKTYMSIDINKANSNWLYLNDGRKISKPTEIVRLEEVIALINKEIKNPELKSKQRKRRRLRWKRLHKKHAHKIYEIVDKLLKEAEQNKSLIAIDTVKTGQTNGTFGQDKLVFYLVKECEERGIPFILTPCAYTSQRCTKCGNINPKNRKNESFICTSCGYSCHADLNGAINLVNFAKELYFNGILGLPDKLEAMECLSKKFCFPKKN